MLVNVLQRLPLTTSVIGAVAFYTTTRIIIRNIKNLIGFKRHYSDKDTINLPKELLVQIFLTLEDPYQLLAVSTTCKDWSAICNQYVWRKKHEEVNTIISRIKKLNAEENDPIPVADTEESLAPADVVTKLEFYRTQRLYDAFTNHLYTPKRVEESISIIIRDRPDDLFRTLWRLITRPHPDYFQRNKSKILSLVPFVDQLIFWAPPMVPKLWDYNPWPIVTQIRMVLGLLSMYPFDFLVWHGANASLFSRAALAAVFYFISIGFKGVLVNVVFAIAVGLLSLLKPVQDRLAESFKYAAGLVVLLSLPLPALYLAPVQSIGYALFVAGGVYMHHTKLFEKHGLSIMRTSLLTTVGLLAWTYTAACYSWK